jgi:hypothetical protein
LFVSLFLKGQATPPKRIVLDLDATDDPAHGAQEGRFFHGYYRCYCYLPLYIFRGRELLLAKLRPADIDAAAGAKDEVAWTVAQIRASRPKVEIWLRADSGFCREEPMASRSSSAACGSAPLKGARPIASNTSSGWLAMAGLRRRLERNEPKLRPR